MVFVVSHAVVRLLIRLLNVKTLHQSLDYMIAVVSLKNFVLILLGLLRNI